MISVTLLRLLMCSNNFLFGQEVDLDLSNLLGIYSLSLMQVRQKLKTL